MCLLYSALGLGLPPGGLRSNGKQTDCPSVWTRHSATNRIGQVRILVGAQVGSVPLWDGTPRPEPRSVVGTFKRTKIGAVHPVTTPKDPQVLV